MNFLSNRPLIMVYPAYAGGKFIMNCLNLSRHTAPSNRTLIARLLDNPDNYHLRLQGVLSTLPTQHEMQQWQDFEFSDENLFDSGQTQLPTTSDQMVSGKQTNAWIQGISDPDVDNFLQNLMDRGLYWFLTVHALDAKIVARICQPWPNAKVIHLFNHTMFRGRALELKAPDWLAQQLNNGIGTMGNYCQEKYNIIAGKDWPSWYLIQQYHYNIPKLQQALSLPDNIANEMLQYYNWDQVKNNVYTHDVDNTYFDIDKLLLSVKQLYDYLGLDDFQPALIKQYHHAYLSLHQKKTV